MIKLHKKILEYDYFTLESHIIEYRQSLSELSNGERIQAKKVLSILERYRDKIKKRDKIETLSQMDKRKLDKHIKINKKGDK